MKRTYGRSVGGGHYFQQKCDVSSSFSQNINSQKDIDNKNIIEDPPQQDVNYPLPMPDKRILAFGLGWAVALALALLKLDFVQVISRLLASFLFA